MLEVGGAGSAGTEKGVVPDGRTWAYGRRGKELTARWAEETEDTARLRAWQTSYWKGTWSLDLAGTPVEVRTASVWRGTRRYVVDGMQVAESGTTGRWAWRPTAVGGAVAAGAAG